MVVMELIVNSHVSRTVNRPNGPDLTSSLQGMTSIVLANEHPKRPWQAIR